MPRKVITNKAAIRGYSETKVSTTSASQEARSQISSKNPRDRPDSDKC